MPWGATPSVRELRSRIGRYRLDDLPEMIAMAREAEMACMVGLRDLRQEIRDEQQEAGAQRGERDISILIWSDAVERWDGRIRWLQNLRWHLEKEQQQHEDADASLLMSFVRR
jgi:hypothetical protein